MFTIKSNNKTVGMCHGNKWHILVFKSAIQARAVQYQLDEKPLIMLLDRKKTKRDALMIQKRQKDAIYDPVSDLGYYIETTPIAKIARYPFENDIGLVIALGMLEENILWFTFDVEVISPVDKNIDRDYLESLL